MRKVLIIDDEQNICRLLHHLIEWEELELQCVGIVNNIEDAYNVAMDQRPDIIITDIQLPGMTGLELIEKLQQEGLNSKLIIITGYKTFDNAFKAIKLGCNDFLLKPINKTELNDSLRRLCRSFSQVEDETTKNSEQELQTQLRQQFLLNVVHGEIQSKMMDPETLKTKFLYNFKEGLLQIGILRINRSSFPESFRTSVLNRLGSAFEKNIRSQCHEFEMVMHHGNLLFILNYQEGAISQGLSSFTLDASTLLEPYPFVQYTLGLGVLCSELTDLEVSYKTSKYAVASRVILGHNRIIDANRDPLFKEGVKQPAANQSFYKDINTALDLLAPERLKDALGDLFRQNATYLTANPAVVLGWYRETAMSVLNMFKDKQINAAYEQREVFAELDNCLDLNDLSVCLTGIFTEIIQQHLTEKKTNDGKIIRIAKNYIGENYGKSLKLDTVASQVYLSPSYFGILFKKETGTTFTNYLMDVRMAKAKEYLQDLKYNIAEIAEMIGFQNSKYFSRLFKQYNGITPAQYRKLHHQ